MTRRHVYSTAFVLLLFPVFASVAAATGFSVDVWTNRGSDGVYKPGEGIQINVRPSVDAYVLLYEIDAEGYVHRLYPYDRATGLIEGRRSYRLGEEQDEVELVAQGPVGQGFIVAIASLAPFEALPWYLRSVDRQAEELGYDGAPEEDRESITAEGRIVGDPFVVMERIRRRVVADPKNANSFATAYTSYYLHHQVRYPRYLCNDCHRSDRYSFWDGYDPYYTTCSVFDFRVNYYWNWGPTYWFGTVPYFVYVYRDDCPPYYRYPGRHSWSSWDGWGRWQTLWGGNLRRFKTPPPPGYIPPTKYDGEFRRPVSRALPPGFIASAPKERLGRRIGLPSGRQAGDFGGDGGKDRGDLGGRLRRDQPQQPRGESGDVRERGSVRRGGESPVPAREVPRPDLEGGRRDRDASPRPERVERRPPPAPRPEPEVESPRNDSPPRAPEPQRSPRPQPQQNEGGSRSRH